jgi:hypothetical protein
MVIIYDEKNKRIQVVRNIEYRKWLGHIKKLNDYAGGAGINPFEQDPVKWENYDFSAPKKLKELHTFINNLNILLNDKNVTG